MSVQTDLNILKLKEEMLKEKVKLNTRQIDNLKSAIVYDNHKIRKLEIHNRIHKASLMYINDQIHELGLKAPLDGIK